MAGIPWGKYERSDWQRVPGGARRYFNVQNPSVTISRRQYDEHYGSAVFQGTYEKKARLNKSPEQLLRPARGRSSALRLSPFERIAELNERKVKQQEIQQDKLIEKLQAKKTRTPRKITLKNFKRNHAIRKIRTGVSQTEIEGVRKAAQQSRIVFGYWVGLEMVSERDGKIKSVSLFSQRGIKTPFTEKDMQDAMNRVMEKSYATLTGMFIALHLTKSAAIRNGVRYR